MTFVSNATVARLRELVDMPDFDGTKYRLRGEIARGGMGTVFLAHDIELDRDVAIKVLNPSFIHSDLVGRILCEARIIAGLEHPSIVPVHDVGTTPDGRIFYAMKLVNGLRLDEYAAQGRSLEKTLRALKSVCDAVAFAHSHGVIHRDLKPENILVGSFGEVLVMDWGVAKLVSTSEEQSRTPRLSPTPAWGEVEDPFADFTTSDTTAHGTAIGTPGFMAPEQTRGDGSLVDERSDVYALGAILLSLVTGETKGDAVHDWNSSFDKIPSSSKGRSRRRALKAICLKCLSDDPDDRYANASALATDITSFLEGGAVSAYRESVFERLSRWSSNNRFILFLILAYLIMRAAVLFFSGR